MQADTSTVSWDSLPRGPCTEKRSADFSVTLHLTPKRLLQQEYHVLVLVRSTARQAKTHAVYVRTQEDSFRLILLLFCFLPSCLPVLS